MKITFVLILLATTFFVFINIQKVTRGEAINTKTVQFVQFFVSILLVLTVIGTFHGIR